MKSNEFITEGSGGSEYATVEFEHGDSRAIMAALEGMGFEIAAARDGYIVIEGRKLSKKKMRAKIIALVHEHNDGMHAEINPISSEEVESML